MKILRPCLLAFVNLAAGAHAEITVSVQPAIQYVAPDGSGQSQFAPITAQISGTTARTPVTFIVTSQTPGLSCRISTNAPVTSFPTFTDSHGVATLSQMNSGNKSADCAGGKGTMTILAVAQPAGAATVAGLARAVAGSPPTSPAVTVTISSGATQSQSNGVCQGTTPDTCVCNGFSPVVFQLMRDGQPYASANQMLFGDFSPVQTAGENMSAATVTGLLTDANGQARFTPTILVPKPSGTATGAATLLVGGATSPAYSLTCTGN